MLYRNEGHPLVFRRRTTTYYFLKGRRIWQQPSLNKQSSKKKKNATTRKRKVAILFAKSAAAVSKLGSFDLKIVVDTFGLFWSWRDFADVFKWKCQVFYKYHYRENELGIPKKSMKGELCNWVCYTNSERFFFKGLSLKKKSSMDQNF